MTTFFSTNLVHLRKLRNLTQAKAAPLLDIKHSTLANYEAGETEPKMDVLAKFVQFYDIDAHSLIFTDLTKGNVNPKNQDNENGNLKGNPKGKLSTGNSYLNPVKTGINLAEDAFAYGIKSPKVITIDSTGNENILYVPVQARAGYLLGHGDQVFMETLPSFNLPGLRNGTYRMFEVEGISMQPTIVNGDRIICKWVENFDNIRENRVHIVVTKDGIVAKRVFNRIAERGKIVLKSDTVTHRKDYPTYELNPSDILEIWYGVFRLSADFSEPAEIYRKINDLEADVVEMRTVNASLMEDVKELFSRLPAKKK